MIRQPAECFSDQQLFAFRKEFERCDSDHDGLLTPEEFERALRYLGHTPIPADLEEMYKDLRFEGGPRAQQRIDLVSFIKLLYYYLRAADTTDDLIRAFAVFDQSRDGTLTIDDATYILTHLRTPVPEHHIAEMIGRLRRGDRINYAEMIREMRPK
jgi:Ca2+-binding EF-hand superfamily protein